MSKKKVELMMNINNIVVNMKKKAVKTMKMKIQMNTRIYFEYNEDSDDMYDGDDEYYQDS